MKLVGRFLVRARHARIFLALLITASLFAAAQTTKPHAKIKPLLIDFESLGADVDDAPSGFTADVTGGGDPQGWRIEQAPGPNDGTGGRKVLARRSRDASENRSALCIYDDLKARDVDVTVQIKPLSGTFEKSGGVIVRYQDKDNYYLLRGNAHEGNVRFYKVIDGKLEPIAERSTAVTVNKWHKLRLTARGEAFEAFLNDVPLFTASDATINKPGKVGLWTRSDSEALFDDLKIVAGD